MIFYELNKQQKVVGIVSSAIVEATLEEAINTAGKLKFTTSSKLRNDCYYILFKRPSAETYMCFKILTETQNNNQVKYTAVESAYDELASYSYIKDIRPQNHSAKEMLTQILSVTRYQVGYVADTPGKTTNFYYKSVLESLQELTNLFGLEITFDVVFDANDNQIKRRLVNLYQQQGNRTGKRFEYGDKLLSVTKEQSSEELVTALVGRGSSVQVSEGSDGSPDGYSRKITFADIEWKKASGNPLDKPLGQEFLEDPSATALYGFSDGKPRIGIIEFSNIKDKNELIQATYEKLQELKRPKVSFKAAVTDVGDLALGDTVAIIRHDLQIEYLTRVYKVTHNLLNEQDNTVEFGDSFQSASITNKLSNIQQDVQSARERSESAVQAANEKNTNFYSSSKPSSAIEGDLWYKDLGNGETELYAWHNGNWELVVSTADTTAVKRQVEQAQSDLEQVRADANRISETQSEADKRLSDRIESVSSQAMADAQNLTNQLSQAQDTLNAKILDAQSTLKQTADGLELTNKNVENIKGNLNTLSGKVTANNKEFGTVYTKITQAKDDAVNAIKGDSKWGALSNIITNSSFLQTADGFAQQVSKQIVPAIDGIKIGTRNLLQGTSDTFKTFTGNSWLWAHTYTNFKAPYISLANFHSDDWLTYSVWCHNKSSKTVTAELYFYDQNSQSLGGTQGNKLAPGATGWLVVSRQVTSNSWYVRPTVIATDGNGTNLSVELREEQMVNGNKRVDWTPAPEDFATVVSVNKVIDTADSHTQIIKDYLTNDNSQFKLLKNAVNLKVEKGDVIGQINLEAGKTLLQNKKIYLDADTVAFSGKAFIPSAAITELSADKITTGTLNAAAVKVINIDASKITTGKLNGMAVKIDGKTSEIDMTTDRGVIFRQKNGTWATTLTSKQIQFENNSSGQNEILGFIGGQYSDVSKSINGIRIVIPTQQQLGAPYGGDEFTIGYATDRNGHANSDFIYNASGQVRSKGFHWYESSHLYGKAQILYIDGAHDPLWIRGVKFDKSSQNGYYQPTISAGWGGNTYGNSGISFLWDSILLYGSVQLGNIRVADATNAIGVGWTSWSDWNNEKYPSFTNENGSNHGGIAFPPNGNTVVWSGMTGQRQNTWK